MMPVIVLVSTVVFTVTSYRSVPAQTDSTPFVTSVNEHVNGAVCAVSQEQLGHGINYGDYLYLDVVGHPEMSRPCWVADCMNKRMKHSIDVWVHDKAEEHRWGVRRARIYQIKGVRV